MPPTPPPAVTFCPAIATEPFVSIIYGYPGTAKSPVCATLPGVTYYDLQNGTVHCDVHGERVTIEGDDELAKVADFERKIIARRPRRTRFTVVDPITTLYEWAVQSATERYKRLPVGKNFEDSGCQTILDLTASDAQGRSFAPGYRYVRAEFMRLVRLIWPQVNHRVIFVGHVRDAMFADVGMGEKGGKTDATVNIGDVDIDGKLRGIFVSECDITFYAFLGTVQRGTPPKYENAFKLTSAARKASAFTKCRCPHLDGKTFTFSNPATFEDWRQIYPESIAELCDSKAVAPPAAAPAPTPAAPPLPASPTPAASVKPTNSTTP